MRKNRKVETADERQERQDGEAQERARAHTEDRTIDEMIRQSIQLYGA